MNHKKSELGCDEVVLSVEIFNQYGTAQKYVESLRAENSAQALLIASLKEELSAAYSVGLRQQREIGTLTQQLSDTQRKNAEQAEVIAELAAEWERRLKAIGRDCGSYAECARELRALVTSRTGDGQPLCQKT